MSNSKYTNHKPIACKPTSNWGGIEILSTDGDSVIVRDNYGNKPSRAHSSKIRYNAKGETYFKHNGRANTQRTISVAGDNYV